MTKGIVIIHLSSEKPNQPYLAGATNRELVNGEAMLNEVDDNLEPLNKETDRDAPNINIEGQEINSDESRRNEGFNETMRMPDSAVLKQEIDNRKAKIRENSFSPFLTRIKSSNGGRAANPNSGRETADRQERYGNRVGKMWEDAENQREQWINLKEEVDSLEKDTNASVAEKRGYYRTLLHEIKEALGTEQNILETIDKQKNSKWRQGEANRVFLRTTHPEQEEKLKFFEEIIGLLKELHEATQAPGTWPQEIIPAPEMVDPPVELKRVGERVEMEMDEFLAQGDKMDMEFETADKTFEENTSSLFPGQRQLVHSLEDLQNRTYIILRQDRKLLILADDWEKAVEINNRLLGELTGEEVIIKSNDESIYFHNMTPETYPLHELILRNGAIIILLQNVANLPKGTRLIINDLSGCGAHSGDRYISCTPVAGHNSVKIKPKFFTDYGFSRYQFPVRLCFAMTIDQYNALEQNVDSIMTKPWTTKEYQQLFRTSYNLFVFDEKKDPTFAANLQELVRLDRTMKILMATVLWKVTAYLWL